MYRLVGRVTPGESPWPDAPPFAEGADLVATCAETRPCAAERWRAETGADLTLLRKGAVVTAGEEDWPAEWRAARGVLAACLPDPLANPPAGDPGAFRSLVRAKDRWTWVVRLSGDNPCRLDGLVTYDAQGGSMQPQGLSCEGRSWGQGGQECAMEHYADFRRDWARAHWRELDPSQQGELLLDLQQDPAAADLVREIEAGGRRRPEHQDRPGR